MSQPSFQAPVRAENVIAGVQASSGATINYNFASSAPPRSIRPFSTVPFPPDPQFVERTDILLWLRDRTRQPSSRAALVGLGGIGKSQVAIHYAHEVRQASDTWVFWVHASSKARFEEAYRNIADRLQIPGRDDPNRNVLRLVHAWLCDEENGPRMMVLDNADSVEVFFPKRSAHDLESDWPLASFLPKTGRGSIVITSRNTDAAEKLAGLDAIYQMQMMETSQAIQLFRNGLGEECGDDTAIADLVDALDYIPLAITQAAVYIRRRRSRMSVSAYLDEFRRSDKKKASLLNKDGADLRRDESASNSIVTTWQITFEQIHRTRPAAADLLSFMSFFNPQGIPESMLQAYACDHGGADDLDEDLEALRGYSLVAVTANREMFEMHPLVQFCTQVWLSSFSNVHQWEREFLKVMSDHYPLGKYENWVECQKLNPHIEAIIKIEPSNTKDALRWTILLTNFGYYRKSRGRYNEAEQATRRVLDVRERVLGREHPSTLTSMGNLASVLQNQGKSKEAEEVSRRALEGHERVFGRGYPGTLIIITNLALALQEQGKYKEAEEANRRVLEIQERKFGREHPNTLICVSNLALVLQCQGKYEEAEEINRQALEIQERVLGREHPDTLTSMANLAWVLQNQGKYEAEQMTRQALNSKERVLGREHPSALISVINLASVLQNQGKYEEAEEINRQALEIQERVLGREHPDTLTSMANLAWVLQNQGKYEEAEQMTRQALNSKERVLGREHPETLASVFNLAYLLHKQTRFTEAARLYERACSGLLEVLGADHPFTRSCVAHFHSLREDIANENAQKQ